MAAPGSFRRIVLGLHPGSVDKRIVRMTVEFARWLDLEMLGIFLEDEALARLAQLPFVHELRLPGHVWHPLEADRIAAEWRRAADEARALLQHEGGAKGIVCRFEIRRGRWAVLSKDLDDMSDILVVARPTSAAGQVALTFAQAWQGNAHAPLARLFLSAGTEVPEAGPVIVVAAGRSDPAIAVGAHIASATGAGLKMLLLTEEADAGTTSPTSIEGLPADKIEIQRAAPTHLSSLEGLLIPLQGRLLVVGPDALGLAENALSLLVACRIPVLVIEGTSARTRPRSTRTNEPGP
jgi:hypothetical protein